MGRRRSKLLGGEGGPVDRWDGVGRIAKTFTEKREPAETEAGGADEESAEAVWAGKQAGILYYEKEWIAMFSRAYRSHLAGRGPCPGEDVRGTARSPPEASETGRRRQSARPARKGDGATPATPSAPATTSPSFRPPPNSQPPGLAPRDCTSPADACSQHFRPRPPSPPVSNATSRTSPPPKQDAHTASTTHTTPPQTPIREPHCSRGGTVCNPSCRAQTRGARPINGRLWAKGCGRGYDSTGDMAAAGGRPAEDGWP